jgi:hypothetical protein
MLPEFEIITVYSLDELNENHDIEISNISDNITVSEIYESGVFCGISNLF